MALNSVFRDFLVKCKRAWLCSQMALENIQPKDLGEFVFTQPHARPPEPSPSRTPTPGMLQRSLGQMLRTS